MDNPEDRGTEKDGSKSDRYCKFCYQDGKFTDPDLTLDRMIEIATSEMKKQHLPETLITQAVTMLPQLERWRKQA